MFYYQGMQKMIKPVHSSWNYMKWDVSHKNNDHLLHNRPNNLSSHIALIM
jgi:hypothetical protein